MDIRTSQINLNHWYVVAKSRDVAANILAVTIWKQNIVLYRDSLGKINALEDRCPHRQVKLSSGKIVNNNLECAYHGWQFNNKGKCNFVPYLTDKQKLPTCKIKSYPVRELNGFIWVFPGEGNYQEVLPLTIPEWDHLNYIATVSVIEFKGHFSYLIENLMDMYHGHLHNNYQAWASANLVNLEANESQVNAYYDAQSYYKIDKIWSISQLFFPNLRRLHPEPLNVSYIYPHWKSTLGNDFTIYCLFCPVNETSTRAFLVHLTSLNAFWRLHKLPIWFRRFIKNSLFGSAQKLLDGLVVQDVKMMEEEQESYSQNPQLKNHELNPTIAKVQQLIYRQSIHEL
jgi:phenylpropionate dioxygenase-like ring-hydroxylating dioxygenase large terminal subunit